MSPPLPEISVSWQYRVNLNTFDVATAAGARRELMLQILNTLLGLGTGWTDASGTSITPVSPWDVVQTSNGGSVSATNLLEEAGDLLWAAEGVEHAWGVYVHQDYFGTDEPLYLCIDLTQGGSHDCATVGVYLSREGFDATEGSITDRPTATDEVEVLPSGGSMTTAPWQGPATNDEDHRVARMHGFLSSDGRNFRIVICRGGVDCAWWDLCPFPDYDLTEWSMPAAMTVASLNSDDPFFIWDNRTVIRYHTRDDVSVGGAFALQMSTTTTDSGPLTEMSANSCTGASGWDSIKLEGRTPAAGLFGAIPDAWWGRSAEPDAAFGDDRTFQQMTNVVVPWNGSIVVKA